MKWNEQVHFSFPGELGTVQEVLDTKIAVNWIQEPQKIQGLYVIKMKVRFDLIPKQSSKNIVVEHVDLEGNTAYFEHGVPFEQDVEGGIVQNLKVQEIKPVHADVLLLSWQVVGEVEQPRSPEKAIPVAKAEAISVAKVEGIPAAKTEAIPVAKVEEIPAAKTEAISVAKVEEIPATKAEAISVAKVERIPAAKTETIPVAKVEEVPTAKADTTPVAKSEEISIVKKELVSTVREETIPATYTPEQLFSFKDEFIRERLY